MATATQPLTPDLLRLAGVALRHRRANDPWSGPNGSARPDQLPPPGDWRTWLILSGRGWGKTRTGAEFIRQEVQAGRMGRVALVGSTAADVRDVMVNGESGLKACCHRAGFGVTYNPSLRKLTFANGAVAFTYSADEPDRLRGPQHDGAWSDEMAAWRYPDARDQLQFGLRLGADPREVVTSTPRPTRMVKDLIAAPGTVTTRGSTYDNRANLPLQYFTQIIRKYEGTTLGRQELMGELVEDIEGALWVRRMIDDYRVRPDQVPELVRIATAVDPATTYGENSDATGLATVGRGVDGDYYVLDIRGLRVAPHQWASEAIRDHDRFEANEIAAESNQGGEMVRETINTAAGVGRVRPRVRLIHASRGKRVRAEPVASLYEQGRIHHVGTFASAEDQLCGFPVSGDNDDECFVAGTLIDTPSGPVPIERIRAGDMVCTPIGPCSVLAAGTTGIRPVVTRQGLTGTANHPVYVQGRGFVSLGSITEEDQLQWTIQTPCLLRPRLLLTVCGTDSWEPGAITSVSPRATRSEKEPKGSMSRFGKMRIGAKSRPAIRFIISMKTRSTTLPKTLNQYFNQSIEDYMSCGIPAWRNTSIASALSPLPGIVRQKVGHGIVNMPSGSQMSAWLIESVSRAVQRIERWARGIGVHDSAVADLPEWPISQPERESRHERVYNLTVAHAHTYFANGILVHNCDALVHAVMAVIDATTGPAATAAEIEQVMLGSYADTDPYDDPYGEYGL